MLPETYYTGMSKKQSGHQIAIGVLYVREIEPESSGYTWYVCVCVCMCVCVGVYIYIYILLYINMVIYIYICTYIIWLVISTPLPISHHFSAWKNTTIETTQQDRNHPAGYSCGPLTVVLSLEPLQVSTHGTFGHLNRLGAHGNFLSTKCHRVFKRSSLFSAIECEFPRVYLY